MDTVNVPVAPARFFQELLAYQSVRQARFAGWSPDGRGILIRTQFGNAAQMHRVYRPGGRREQVTFFSEPPTGRFVPKNHDGDLILNLSRHGDERYQLYLYEPKDFRMTLLTDGHSRHTLGPFSPDGKKMMVRSNQRNDRDMDLYVMETGRRSAPELLLRVTDEYWYASHWSNDGRQLLLRRHVSVVESYPAIYDFAAASLSMLPLAAAERAAYANLRFAPDGRHVYMTTDAFSEFQELVRGERKTQKYERLTPDIFGDWLRAGVETAGIANFSSFLEQTESYRRARRRVEYGDERTAEMRQFFTRINPTSNADQITTPLLVVHGAHDPRVPFNEARQIVERLRALNREVWAVYVNDEGHSFRKRTNTDYISVVAVMFLSKHLLGTDSLSDP